MQQWNSFISPSDLAALRFPPIWERLRAHTPMGEQLKETCRPYDPSDKETWQHDIEEVQRMRAVVKDMDRFRLYVKGVTDLTPIINAWILGSIPNRMDWFHVKSFLQKGLRVLSLPNWELYWDRFPHQAKSRWSHVLELLSPAQQQNSNVSESFQLEALFPELFQPLLTELRLLEQEKQRLLVSRKQSIEQELGFAIGQKDPFYIARNEQDKITALESHHAFVKIKETPFDIAFAWNVNENEQLLQRRQEDIDQRWQQAEQLAMKEIANKVLPYREELLLWVKAFGQLDFTYAKACLAEMYDGIVPIWHEGDHPLTLRGGIHPWLAEQWGARGNIFTPVDIQLHIDQVAVIIGPNMGGKSVAMKTLGLCTLMAQLGLLVPAQYFSFTPVNGIVLIGGEYEQMEIGLSSFGGEMQQLSTLFERDRTGQLLVLCDEVGRGTNPEEGEALAIAVAEELGKSSWYTCFISHYSRVVKIPNIRMYQNIDYRLVPVENGTIPRMALQIAEQMGMPSAVIDRARQVLENHQKGE